MLAEACPRGREMKLSPILREHGIAFIDVQYVRYLHAWSCINRVDGRPIAAGFLTGKLINKKQECTCFSDENPLGKMIAKSLWGR